MTQLNPTVGAIASNAARIQEAIDVALHNDADLLVLPECALSGYPPQDFLFQEGFLEQIVATAESLAAATRGIAVLLGTPWPLEDGKIANSVLLLRDGKIEARYDKRLLPTYDVFDEHRYFQSGDLPLVFAVAGLRIGVAICEDLWAGQDVGEAARYNGKPDPTAETIDAGAQLLVVPSASPFVLGKNARHAAQLSKIAATHNIAVASVNQVGSNDELVFTGHASLYVPNAETPVGAQCIAATNGVDEEACIVDLPTDPTMWATLEPVRDPASTAEFADESAPLWNALRLGVADYAQKTGFTRGILGLSGGIDSAVVACIAAAAFGADNVLGVCMPSRYSSEGSVLDAKTLGNALQMRIIHAPITDAHEAAESTLAPIFATLCDQDGIADTPGVAEENIQPRLRCITVMGIANKLHLLPLTTGNKSELAVGYCTLYGDMAGGLAVLSDLTKRRVYALAKWINAHYEDCGFASPPIPQSTIEKPPSAELRPDQTDQDTLPSYDVLDTIVERYVEQRQSPSRIATETGFDSDVVHRIVRAIDRNEYKRRQSPIGLKVTSVAFGSGRRMPIAQRFTHTQKHDSQK